MSCKFKDECPSYSGWCEAPKQDFARCIPFLISAIQAERNKHPKVLYRCDQRACDKCNDFCGHTLDIRHAKNFVLASGAKELVFMEE